MKKILYILCVYYRMSKVAHNLSRYLKLSVDMLHVIMFSGNIVKYQRHIAHAIRILVFETFVWYSL